MISLETVKNISKYTNNIEILKLVLNNNIDYNRIISLYSKFDIEDADNQVPQNVMDAIALEYFKETEHSVLTELLKSSAFIKILSSIKDDDLKKYLRHASMIDSKKKIETNLCSVSTNSNQDNKFFYILTDQKIIEYYKEDHIDLVELFHNTIRQLNNPVIHDLVIEAAKNKFRISVIKRLVTACANNPDDYMISLFHKIAWGCKSGQFLSNDTIDLLIKNITKKCNKESEKYDEAYADILTNAIVGIDVLLPIVSFKTIHNLINHVVGREYEDYSLIFNPLALRNRSKEEIIEMLEYINTYPMENTFFYDEDLITEMEWEEQKDLFEYYKSNPGKFRSIKTKILEHEASNTDLYSKLKYELDKEEYTGTLEDYLNTCNDIQTFIEGLEPVYDRHFQLNLAKTDPITAIRKKNN